MRRSWAMSALAAAVFVTGVIASPHAAFGEDTSNESSNESSGESSSESSGDSSGDSSGEPSVESSTEPSGPSEFGTWRGWALAGGGAALLMSGVAWQVQSSSDYEVFDRDFAALCPLGCVGSQLPEDLRGLLDRAENRKTLALLSYGIGAVLATAGAYYVYRDAGRGARSSAASERGSKDRLLPRTSRLLIIGSGLAVLAAGSVLQFRASQNFDDYDQQFEARCGLMGCLDSAIPDLDKQLSTARLQRNLAFAGYAVGGVTLAVGAVLAYLDRRSGRSALAIQPNIGKHVATLDLKGTF